MTTIRRMETGTAKNRESLLMGQRDDGSYQYFKVTDDGLIPFDADIDIGDVHLLDLSDSKINPATLESVQDVSKRFDTIDFWRVDVVSPATPVQITATAYEIPTGSSVTLRAFLDNVGLVYINTLSATVSTNGLSLSAGDSVTLRIRDVSNLWMDSDEAAEGVEVFSERD